MPLQLDAADAAIDGALDALYGAGPETRQGGPGGSAPCVARWLGDIRQYFPSSVVQVMQKDALDRPGLQQMLCEPETPAAVEPDVHLVATLLGLNRVMPNKTRQHGAHGRCAGRRRIGTQARGADAQSVAGSLNRAARNRRPRHQDIGWLRTIRANLKHYRADYRTVIPETRIDFARRGRPLRDIVLCVDQSGSMASSVVYASVFAAVLASIHAVTTSVAVFDTAVVYLTPMLSDPVDVLFGTQLGGGTDINRALAYCRQLVTRARETIFVLISDLYEGGNEGDMLSRAASLAGSGAKVVALLALDDNGAPSYDRANAPALTTMGIPCFACTPDLFPDLTAAVIQRQGLDQ